MKQTRFAHSTHRSSQPLEQQFGSIAQTSWQHSESAQYGRSCAVRQEPAAGAPQLLVSWMAMSTQLWSQPITQQYSKPIVEQTASQTKPSLQEGDGCGVKQLSSIAPQVEQNFFARATQSSSHATSQQTGSIVQTRLQQSGLLQPRPTRLISKQVLVAVSHEVCARASIVVAASASTAMAIRAMERRKVMEPVCRSAGTREASCVVRAWQVRHPIVGRVTVSRGCGPCRRSGRSRR